ncbi:MAG: hypothetical protein ABI330_12975, partial [Caldimonas sp.]
MADEPTDIVAAPVATPVRKRRVGRWLGGGLATIVLLASLLVVGLYWALHNAAGSAWLVTLVPQLHIIAPKGSLFGDFSAERIDITLPGTSGVLRLDAPRWHALDASRGDHGRWLHLTIDALHADRVTLLRGSAPSPTPAEPASPPRTLRLPVEIEVRAASIDELRFGAASDAPTLRPVLARIHLGADGGALHRFDDLATGYDRAGAAGSASIGADAPFLVDAHLALASTATVPPWHASVAASGPLSALTVNATARVSPSATHAAQSLDAEAVVKPFAAWPLGALHVATTALDLSAFSSAAPATTLSGHAVVTTSGVDRPATLSIDLRNERAGRWNEGLLPVRSIQGDVRGRPDAPNVLDVQSLVAELGSAKLVGGRATLHGRWTTDTWTFDVDLAKVRPAALDARAPETSLDGKTHVVGTGFAAAKADAWAVDLAADISGQLADRRLPKAAPRDAHVQAKARITALDIDLRSAEARLGSAKATLAAHLTRKATNVAWHAKGQATLVDFDPAPWWPGATDSLWARGSNRLNAKGEFDLDLPAANASSAYAQLAATRGKASIAWHDSTLAGVPLEGAASFANSDGTAQPALDLVAAGNRIHIDGRVAVAAGDDAWRVSIDAPELARLSPLVRAPGSAASSPALAGTLTATGHVDGRWPDVTSQGELHGAALRYGTLTTSRADA